MAWLARGSCITLVFYLAKAAVEFEDIDSLPKSESLADGFRISLVRPDGEAANSGEKSLVYASSAELLDDTELKVLEDYDAIFEKYSMFCNGRWLGAQILQDSQDLQYLQHIVYMRKPDAIVETGTYKGGLTYFFASLLDWVDREAFDSGSSARNTQVLSVDRHHPDTIYAAKWFCPVCADCIRPYLTPVWQRKVRFLQGMSDEENTYFMVVENLLDLGVLALTREETSGPEEAPQIVADPSKVVVVNLDANHEFDGVLRELILYGLLVTQHSYLVVQDAKLDKIWGTRGPTAAVEQFLRSLPPGEFVHEPELAFHGYSQHIYLRRAQVTVPHTFLIDGVVRVRTGEKELA